MLIGVDLGGTKIEVAAFDAAGAALARRRIPTPVGDYRATLGAVVDLVRWVEAETGQEGSVGVAHPGSVSPATGLIKNSNSTVLIGTALDRDLAAALGRPVRMANDADCFTLSEATDGAGEGASIVFGVILGTGVGGGIVVGDTLLQGPNALSGEWGHNPLPWPQPEELPGPLCYCGLHGCIETFLSGRGLVSDYGRASGVETTVPAIVERAAAGDDQARGAVNRYCHRLARGLASVINVVDPEVIVLGGGLSNLELLYRRVPELWGPFVFSDRVETALVRNHHGDSSGVRGAAWLWGRPERV